MKKYLPKLLVFILILTIAIFFIYTANYYHADERALESIARMQQSDATVTIQETTKWFFFDGPGTESAYVFYPGAKVQETAYAPLMEQLAANGMDVYLVKMPFRLAFFGMNRAAEAIEAGNYNHWYIGGHSLGGAMAANYAASHLDELDGAILFAAYPTKSLANSDFTVLSFYGSEDGVLNLSNYESGKKYMPEDFTEVMISGGNHAQFGDYGLQNGDGTATISTEEQQSIVVTSILDKYGPMIE